ncbi:MAG: hypothetical protein PHE56_05535 [Bacteroidales bacterium]|nr:hypothetical protein [Bacteroidales bacterium]
MKSKFFIILSILMLVGIVSCFKPDVYPPEPHIDFVEFVFVDTVDALDNPVLNGTLKFFFVDGDGDIGHDTTSPIKNTIFIEKFAIRNGQEVLLDLQIPLEFYVPVFENSDPDMALKGDMFVNDLNEIFPFSDDTIIYKFYIVDRAGNKSNVEETGFLILKNYITD